MLLRTEQHVIELHENQRPAAPRACLAWGRAAARALLQAGSDLALTAATAQQDTTLMSAGD